MLMLVRDKGGKKKEMIFKTQNPISTSHPLKGSSFYVILSVYHCKLYNNIGGVLNYDEVTLPGESGA